MKKSSKRRCGLCGRETGESFRRIIIRDAEERGNSIQLFAVGEQDICAGCWERFGDFVERCRLSAEE